MRILSWASVLVCSTLGVAFEANGATKPPSALLGKSVLLSWQEARIERRVGTPTFHTVMGTIKLTIYVSADGHVFNRYANATSGQTFQNDQVAGEKPAGRPWSFDGTSMSTVTPFGSVTGKPSAARHITVSFQDGFAQCSVSSTWAKENGAETSLTVAPVDHSQFETQSITTAATSCAVQNGNVFGAK
jgi:hypothetical protein